MLKDKKNGIKKFKKAKDLKDFKPLPKKDLTKFKGGQRKKNNRSSYNGCGGILPQ